MPAPNRPAPRLAVVEETQRLSPGMVRIVFGGEELRGFAPEHADGYVKLHLPAPGAGYSAPFDAAAIRETLPREQWPRTRSYTVRAWDPDAHRLTIDFVVHGEDGVAGPWAADARAGDLVQLGGPGGAYSPDPEIGFHLLVGDEAVLPAIAVALEQLPPDAQATVVAQTPGPDHRLPLPSDADVTVVWLDGHASGDVTDAVAQIGFDTEDTQAFVHGEAQMVRAVRLLLVRDRGLPIERLSASGYWKSDVDDEGWRAQKREFNAAADAELARLA